LARQRDTLQEIVDKGTEYTQVGGQVIPILSDQAKGASDLLRYLEGTADEQGRFRTEAQNTSGAIDEMSRRLGLVDVNMDGVIDDADAIAGNLERGTAALLNIPKTIDIGVSYYRTGVGASLIDPNSANYSPGHVAIYTSKKRP
jgi:hypothetical protein